MRIRFLIAATLILPTLDAQVTHEDILRGPNKTWLTYSGDYGSRRHSPLDQINRSNVASLVPRWVYHVEGARRLETTPLVYKGIMYITDTNGVDALNARTGQRLWHFAGNDRVYATPISYLAGGKQYVSLPVGDVLITFGLD